MVFVGVILVSRILHFEVFWQTDLMQNIHMVTDHIDDDSLVTSPGISSDSFTSPVTTDCTPLQNSLIA